MSKQKKKMSKKFTTGLLKNFLPVMGLSYFLTLILAFSTLFLSVLSGPAIKMFFNSDTPKDATSIIDPATLAVFNIFGYSPNNAEIEYIFTNLAFFVLGLAAIRFVLQVIIYGSWEWIGEKIARTIRSSLTEGYIYLDPTAKSSPESKPVESSLATVITAEVFTFKYYIVRFFGGIPREAIQSIFLLTALITISFRLTLIFIFVLFPLAYLLSRIAKKVKKRSRAEFDSQNSLAEWIQQRILGIETIKHYAAESSESEAMKDFSESLLDKQISTAKTSARSAPISEAISVVAVAAIFYYANRYRADIGLSGSALMSYFSCLAFLSQSINKLSLYANISSRGKAALDKIYSTLEFFKLNRKEKIPHRFEDEKGGSALEIKNLGFSYKNSQDKVLDNLNLDFEYGKMYAITGPSGAGKSTLLNIILGCLNPSSGSLSLFNSNKKENRIVYMPQILEGSYLSVGQILSYPELVFDGKKATESLKKANIHDSLISKGMNLDHELGFGTTELSGGEWQRLNLARVFYHDTAIIIADESTSALDPKTEKSIISEFKNLVTSGSCIITVAHRPAMIEACDVNYDISRM
jgi:ABC-type multidrug transport system fused ATPase/permease subunit